MGEISNKTLAVLVVIAIIVSLIGLFIGRDRIVTVGKPTGTGDIYAKVESNIDIEVEYAIDFTAGGTETLSYGETQASDGVSPECDPCWVLVGGIGLTPVTISYVSDKNIWFYDPTGTTYHAARDHESSGFQVKVEPADGTATFASATQSVNYNACGGAYTPLVYTDADVTGVGTDGTEIVTACSQYQGFRMGAQVTCPPINEPATSRTTVVTFSAVAT